jgi:hypothetical protein
MKFLSSIKIIAILSLALILVSCSKKGSDTKPQTTQVTISSLNITSGPYNTSVVITGTGFDATKTNDKVFFNGKAATVTAATTTRLTVTVPLGAGSGNVTVSVNNGETVIGPAFYYVFTTTLSTVAGSGLTGFTDSQGAGASFTGLWGIAIDPSGNLFVTDVSFLRKILPDGTVRTFAGDNTARHRDGTGTQASFDSPLGLFADASGNIYVAEMESIRKVTPDAIVSTVQGSAVVQANYKDIVTDAAGNIFSCGNNVITKITPDGALEILAGNSQNSSIDGLAPSASFSYPTALCLDHLGNIYVADQGTSKVRMITYGGYVNTIAGNGLRGNTDGPALSASFKNITGVAVDAAGNIYVSDAGNYTIRMITPDGMVSTIAGDGSQGFKDGPGLSSQLFSPQALVLDNSGNIYIADGLKVRKITLQ